MICSKFVLKYTFLRSQHSRLTLMCICVQNVKPEKLFSKERAVGQLLDIINKATAEDTGRFIAWDGQAVPW